MNGNVTQSERGLVLSVLTCRAERPGARYVRHGAAKLCAVTAGG